LKGNHLKFGKDRHSEELKEARNAKEKPHPMLLDFGIRTTTVEMPGETQPMLLASKKEPPLAGSAPAEKKSITDETLHC
jgi:hypothetical protein